MSRRSSGGEFNLAHHAGNQDFVDENRAALADLLGVSAIQWLNQVHGTECVRIDDVEASAPTADAAVTQQPRTALGLLTADCLPVVLADREAGVVGICHAGWQGLAGGVLERTLSALDLSPDRIWAWIGPAIGVKHYEVGEEVWGRFSLADSEPYPGEDGKRTLNLAAAADRALREAGVTSVERSQICCYEDERYYSHRRSMRKGDPEGRFATVVMLDGQ